jgi:hypothetical protein
MFRDLHSDENLTLKSYVLSCVTRHGAWVCNWIYWTLMTLNYKYNNCSTVANLHSGFRPGYSCESQVITVCQDIADSLDNGGRTDATVTDFSKAFD